MTQEARPRRAVLVERDECESTNDDARALAEEGAPIGTIVLARAQTRGRGRAGRAFSSPEGGLYMSIVLRPTRAADEWTLLPLLVGLATVEELAARGLDARVKWPNDILVGREKLGGILVETRWGTAPYAVAGVGLNLSDAPIEGATSARAHGLDVAPRELAVALGARVADLVRAWERDGAAPLLDRLRARCVTLGENVVWENGDGVAVDVAPDGALVVDAGGERRRILAGDVRVRWR